MLCRHQADAILLLHAVLYIMVGILCRLGQRARRKMAEQAFGSSAKHIAPSRGPGRPAAAAAALDTLARGEARPQSLPPPPRRAAASARGTDGLPSAGAASGLHPSWAAKAAAKAQLAARPAGRKVVFSDDSDAVPAAEPAASGARQLRAAEGAGPRTGAAAETVAHAADTPQPRVAPQAPSRVPGVPRHRDQQRAPAANGAPGGGGRRPAAKLHPSWEAKAKLRKQMERLPAPAGTKVVFEDSE
jgi:BUD22